MTDAVDLSLRRAIDPIAISFAGAMAGVGMPAPQPRGAVYEPGPRVVEPVIAADLSDSGQKQGEPRQNAGTYRAVRLPNGRTGAVSDPGLPAATLDTLS